MKHKTFLTNSACPKRLPFKNIAIAWLGAVLATAVFAGLSDVTKMPLILGSFGASCLLMFAYPTSPFAQPRNVICGHFVATLTGLVFMMVFGMHWWSMSLAVGTAIGLMLILRVPHPPAGSNPLIVMVSGAGWSFLLMPTLLGAILLVLVALVYNNIDNKNQYPTYWL